VARIGHLSCTMIEPAAAFTILPSPLDVLGRLRAVGVEVEFMGLPVRAAAEALARALGGTLVEEDPHAFAVQGTRLGDLAVELDIRYAHRRAASGLPIRLGARPAAWLGHGLSRVVPRELITGPLPPARLAEVDGAVAALRDAGAVGHGGAWFGSLGLHFNLDPPGLAVHQLLPILRAYLLLEPWLRRAVRRRSAWPAHLARAFPQPYARRVLAPDYRPDLDGLVTDYLAANPTRDRGLDLLPILAHLDGQRVRARLPHAKIGRRPVLHYRLPQAFVGDPGWSIARDWNRWVAVEELAADPDRLARAAQAYLRRLPWRHRLQLRSPPRRWALVP
jgi:hypothetical protein